MAAFVSIFIFVPTWDVVISVEVEEDWNHWFEQGYVNPRVSAIFNSNTLKNKKSMILRFMLDRDTHVFLMLAQELSSLQEWCSHRFVHTVACSFQSPGILCNLSAFVTLIAYVTVVSNQVYKKLLCAKLWYGPVCLWEALFLAEMCTTCITKARANNVCDWIENIDRLVTELFALKVRDHNLLACFPGNTWVHLTMLIIWTDSPTCSNCHTFTDEWSKLYTVSA